MEYAELESEAPWETNVQPPHDWPTRGCITFDRVNFSYGASAPLVLKNLTFVFKAQEKVLVFILWVLLMWHYFRSIIKRALYLQDYTVCDSWNTYHVIKTVQVDPFIPNLHFELPEETTIYSL